MDVMDSTSMEENMNISEIYSPSPILHCLRLNPNDVVVFQEEIWQFRSQSNNSKVLLEVVQQGAEMKLWNNFWRIKADMDNNFPIKLLNSHFCDVGSKRVDVIVLKNPSMMSSRSFFLNCSLTTTELLAINLSSHGFITSFCSQNCFSVKDMLLFSILGHFPSLATIQNKNCQCS